MYIIHKIHTQIITIHNNVVSSSYNLSILKKTNYHPFQIFIIILPVNVFKDAGISFPTNTDIFGRISNMRYAEEKFLAIVQSINLAYVIKE